MAPKNQPAETIDNDEKIAAESAILRKIESGLSAIETEIDSLTIEQYIGTTREQPGRSSPRNDQLKARLKKNRTAVPAKSIASLVTGPIPSEVAIALELIEGARPTPPATVDLQAFRDQLKKNRDAIKKGYNKQKAVVDALRDEWIYRRSLTIQPRRTARHVKMFRALQIVASLRDEEADERAAEFAAGCRAWRADLLPDRMSRMLLTIGSERDWDSEISRARRELEEKKLL